MKSSRSGFTLIETLVIVVVAGVLAGAGIAKFSSLMKIKKLDGEARALYAAIAYTHAQVLKKDVACLIVFNVPGNAYSVYEDRDADGVADAAELVSTNTLPSPVTFGSASSGPTSGPNATGLPASKVEGGWAAKMLLDRDRAATINAGSVYLYATSVKTKTYCIRMPAGSRKLEFWRWDGSLWIAL
jgi:type II secretory pathway pseudopilin PulG